jgi:predicted  nucleic acid-binding Zn-ribbon protein
MAKIERTVIEKLKELYGLQLIDSKIDSIEILKGELPIEVSDLEDEIVGLQTRINRFQESIDDIEKDLSNHSTNIKESELLITKYEKQLDNVKNNREYDALTKEIELHKLEIQLSQKKIRDIDKTKVIKKEGLDAANERNETKQKELEEKRVELKKIIEKTDKEEATLKRKSDKAQKKIDARLLKAYHKIRSSYRNGMAVVTIERDSCGGCYNQIPPQVQLEISMRKKIIACEHCGRVLVDTEIADELGPKKKG